MSEIKEIAESDKPFYLAVASLVVFSAGALVALWQKDMSLLTSWASITGTWVGMTFAWYFKEKA